MKTFVAMLSVLLILATPMLALAQSSAIPGPNTLVTITGARGDVATRRDCVAGTTQQTNTLQSPGPGLSNYITSIGVWGEATAAVTAAAPAALTVTGLVGTTPTFQSIASGSIGGVTNGTGVGWVTGGEFPVFIKGNTNTAVAIQGPAAITGITQRICIQYYNAP